MRWLISITCLLIIVFITYFFAAEFFSYSHQRKLAMDRKCRTLAEETKGPDYRKKLESMPLDKARMLKRDLDDCLAFWRDGTVIFR